MMRSYDSHYPLSKDDSFTSQPSRVGVVSSTFVSRSRPSEEMVAGNIIVVRKPVNSNYNSTEITTHSLSVHSGPHFQPEQYRTKSSAEFEKSYTSPKKYSLPKSRYYIPHIHQYFEAALEDSSHFKVYSQYRANESINFRHAYVVTSPADTSCKLPLYHYLRYTKARTDSIPNAVNSEAIHARKIRRIASPEPKEIEAQAPKILLSIADHAIQSQKPIADHLSSEEAPCSISVAVPLSISSPEQKFAESCSNQQPVEKMTALPSVETTGTTAPSTVPSTAAAIPTAPETTASPTASLTASPTASLTASPTASPTAPETTASSTAAPKATVPKTTIPITIASALAPAITTTTPATIAADPATIVDPTPATTVADVLPSRKWHPVTSYDTDSSVEMMDISDDDDEQEPSQLKKDEEAGPTANDQDGGSISMRSNKDEGPISFGNDKDEAKQMALLREYIAQQSNNSFDMDAMSLDGESDTVSINGGGTKRRRSLEPSMDYSDEEYQLEDDKTPPVSPVITKSILSESAVSSSTMPKKTTLEKAELQLHTSHMSVSQAPVSQAPVSQAPVSQVPVSQAPVS
ncbi:hypothetical protein A0J61_09251, partial [Choanephora cucurbitarum]